MDQTVNSVKWSDHEWQEALRERKPQYKLCKTDVSDGEGSQFPVP